jgi:hypothetical protein
MFRVASPLVPFEKNGAERFLERSQATGDGGLIDAQAARCGGQGLLACEDDQDSQVISVHRSWLRSSWRRISMELTGEGCPVSSHASKDLGAPVADDDEKPGTAQRITKLLRAISIPTATFLSLLIWYAMTHVPSSGGKPVVDTGLAIKPGREPVVAAE